MGLEEMEYWVGLGAKNKLGQIKPFLWAVGYYP